MNELDKRLGAYAREAEQAPPVATEATLRARLNRRRAEREARWQIGLWCALAGLCALLGLLVTALNAQAYPGAALVALCAEFSLPGAALIGGTVLRQALADCRRADETKNGHMERW